MVCGLRGEGGLVGGNMGRGVIHSHVIWVVMSENSLKHIILSAHTNIYILYIYLCVRTKSSVL